ncbi:hypothetical protein CEXT_103881 [Caerostris extrusa]|uniref:Uncharacterized protein n=1 Tax=Caerostris extrusa TaxID=172846 RepID=A0AAV4QA58_CAEEX|nr:hypothetical protein CEXT_103881 [Caerostris extrusa]
MKFNELLIVTVLRDSWYLRDYRLQTFEEEHSGQRESENTFWKRLTMEKVGLSGKRLTMRGQQIFPCR